MPGAFPLSIAERHASRCPKIARFKGQLAGARRKLNFWTQKIHVSIWIVAARRRCAAEVD